LDQRGFTLLETVSVLCLVIAAAAFILPHRASERILVSEDAAVRLLQRVHRAQRPFLERGGGASFAFLPELLGETLRRRGPPVDPPLLRGTSLRVHGSGAATDDHYGYVIYLALADGSATCRPGALAPQWKARFWVAYAWPLRYGDTGRSLFVCTPEGEIHRTENAVQTFSGPGEIPPANLFLAVTGGDGPLSAPPSWAEDLRWIRVQTP
jgi:hypothetical protein